MTNLKYSILHINRLNLKEISNEERSSCLGTIEQQTSRLHQLQTLIKNCPKLPTPPKGTPDYTFGELFDFESNEKPLLIQFKVPK